MISLHQIFPEENEKSLMYILIRFCLNELVRLAWVFYVLKKYINFSDSEKTVFYFNSIHNLSCMKSQKFSHLYINAFYLNEHNSISWFDWLGFLCFEINFQIPRRQSSILTQQTKVHSMTTINAVHCH